MLQRIQSLFLLAAIVVTALSFVFPVVNGTIGEAKFAHNNYGLFMIEKTTVTKVSGSYLYIISAAVLVFLLFTLSQFKKRSLQIRLCRITYLLVLVQFALYFFIPERNISEIKLAGDVKINYDIAFFLPLAALAFTFFAEKFIQRDERLVKSADRLR